MIDFDQSNASRIDSDGAPSHRVEKPSDNNQEYECKLGGNAAALRKVRSAASAASREKLTWSKDELESVYFDTADLRLGAKQVTLRVRRKKGAFLQNVKSGNEGSGPLFARGEWEQEVDDLTPRLDQLPQEAIELLGLVLPSELNETFRTKFVRESAIVVRGSNMGPRSRIELAIDRGDVLSGEHSEAISECELELIEGDPRDLFELALELQQAAGLRILQESKGARGYRLLNPVPIEPVKAEKVVLRPEQSVNEAIAETFRSGTRMMLANEAASIDGSDPEGVHQFRVAVRRMRSMLSVFSKLLEPNRVDWLKTELKWIADQFGPARDWDVFISEIVEPVRAAGLEAQAMQILLAAAEERRRQGYVMVREALASPRYAALVLKLSAFTETQGWSPHPCPLDHPMAQSINTIAPSVLDRAHKKTRRDGKNLESLDVPARHNLRIRVKKLRYTTDFLQAIYNAPGKRGYLKTLSRLQDDFGHLNDVAVAENLLDDLTADAEAKLPGSSANMASAAGAVNGWHARGLRDSEPHLLADWEAFTKQRPFWRGGQGE